MLRLPNGQTIYTKNELTAMGYGGYAGWNDPEAGLNFAATGGVGKGSGINTQSPVGGGGFNFDFEGENTKAYNELGAYYDRILKEANGDVDLALSRLQQDYETGNRNRAINRANAIDRTIASANARGIYSKSSFDPGAGFGLADENIKDTQLVYDEQQRQADTSKQRTEMDKKTALEREKFRLEQERRTRAAELANSRGQRAYQSYAAGLV